MNLLVRCIDTLDQNFLRKLKFKLKFNPSFLKSRFSLKVLILLGFFLLLYSGQTFQEKPKVIQKSQLPKTLVLIKTGDLSPPELTATGAAVFDIATKTFLFEKNADLQMPPASTTKIMTALVTWENCQPDQVASVSALPKNNFESRMGLVLGEQMTVENLLYGLMLPSGNDAAITLAQTCLGSVEQFVSSMNERGRELGMENTHFQNSTGLDQENHYSTVRDLTKLATSFLENPILVKIAQVQKTTVFDISGKYQHLLENRNKLLGKVPGVLGIKTGTTEGAREAFVSALEKDGQRIIIVLLGSKERFTETEKLINWTFENFKWEWR